MDKFHINKQEFIDKYIKKYQNHFDIEYNPFKNVDKKKIINLIEKSIKENEIVEYISPCDFRLSKEEIETLNKKYKSYFNEDLPLSEIVSRYIPYYVEKTIKANKPIEELFPAIFE